MFCTRRALFPMLFLLGLFLTFWPVAGQSNPSGWSWIWSPDGNHPPETLFFRLRFRLPRRPSSAVLYITADDAFEAYINQSRKPVATGDDWTTVRSFDVTSYLRAGLNLLAVECQNQRGPGGLLFKLVVTMGPNNVLTLVSDGNVRVSRHPPVAWNSLKLNDTNWQHALVIAPEGGGVWGPLHGALSFDYSRIVRIWDLTQGLPQGADLYQAPRPLGARMPMMSSMASVDDMKLVANAGFTLFQSNSDNLSTEEEAPGKWNWTVPAQACTTAHRLGLDWSYFEHEAFPPPWYREKVPFTRIECMEHHLPVQAFSPWDPSWKTFIEQGYAALAKEFGGANKQPQEAGANSGALNVLCVGIHGDYGQAGLLTGGRVRVPEQREDWIKRFGNAHDHLGFWCADPLAQADFRKAMLEKYHTLSALNAAWHTHYQSVNDIAYPPDLYDPPDFLDRQHYLDFIEWYRDSVGRAIRWNLEAARKNFPNTLLLLPAGFADEDLRGGNDNSLIPKLAARYNAAVLSYHGGAKPFAQNAATELGRLGSACRFYGAPLWVATPGSLTPDQTVERIYEAASQGAAGYFDWASNVLSDANRNVYYRYGRFLQIDRPIVDVAMFYPARAQEIRPQEGYNETFARACAELRDYADFDIVDDRMVDDGCLSNYRILVLWEGTICQPQTLQKIKEWVNNGGVLIAYDFGKVTDFNGDISWFKDLFGYVQDLQPAYMRERYLGDLPSTYRIPVGDPEMAGFLEGQWAEPDTADGIVRRWTGETATVRLPLDVQKRYVLVVHASVPPEAADLKHELFVNGRKLGDLDTVGDVRYRFLLPSDLFDDNLQDRIALASLTFRSQTFLPAKSAAGTAGPGPLGIHVESVGVMALEGTETESPEDAIEKAPVPPGRIRSYINLSHLTSPTSSQSWVRRYGKGLTIYFPATRDLLKGYLQVVCFAIYHLSQIDPGRKDALPIDDTEDGVYATLFPDKILYYNSTDEEKTEHVVIPAEDFAMWKDQVMVPQQNEWTLHLPPHSIGAIYFGTPTQELLYECEGFTQPNGMKPRSSPDCSPGTGPTCLFVAAGKSIGTRFRIEVPGNYKVFYRVLHGEQLATAQIQIDGQPVVGDDSLHGQTRLAGTVSLTAGVHTLTLTAPSNLAVRADFVLLSNDPDVAGYTFALQASPLN
ncbi:family 14 glycosylhydrolase [Chthonomonas calidirosea]|uniref:family 14 glycosylhydrolase n=1 Tax=Chthonomonas calidirosea TaxID=454171 RepID=UPI0009490F91|nr:family 14 glycosylhydrolase [Chthonomonas calidirosea]